ncbi:class I SAM-dependent methyltransferase [Paenibacillus barengoltzii]|jgi:ubiquinone/menaquinone biosynthesis C-methylase UbiE|uniref:Methylase involved in ubiquinone/menaquinone biosynthesis n=1 Tax=Paenibacillus barengoltzii J12 TaxID=935846 RepID=A0ABY1M1W2_9BACL|nr:class I SAM-dependent methyltransferase [Paenibacillus barengoltzii]SMF56839.1 Methylase involved in ubiquinone/menaquinone biosynthesis [Paenibacillus barengoltzii J12]
MAEWYELSFGEDYLLVYKHRDAQGAKHEVQRMIRWLHLPPGAKVLDLCCGMGRHSLALAEAGYQVTGVDLSEVLLREARRLDPEGRIIWHRADMRELPFQSGEFAAVVNLFTSFGYFKEDEEQIKVLREASRVLKSGGRFLLDFLNPAYVAAHLVPYSEREDAGQQIVERRRIEDGYVIKDIEITAPGGEPRHYMERIKLYELDDFRQMLKEAGLTLQNVHGDYDEELYDPNTSRRMILVGVRA